jgi:hypothetical protein
MFATFSTENGNHINRYAIFKFNMNRIEHVYLTGVPDLEDTMYRLNIDLEKIPVCIDTGTNIISTYYWKTGWNIIINLNIIPVYDFANTAGIPSNPIIYTCRYDYSEWCNLRIKQQLQYRGDIIPDTIVTVSAPQSSAPQPSAPQPSAPEYEEPLEFVSKEKGIPTFVAEALVKAGISTDSECSISMIPLKDCSKVSVTNCYHCFDASSLTTWTNKKKTCPLCKNEITSIITI